MKGIGKVLLISLLFAITANINAQITFDKETKEQMVLTSLSSIPLAFTENQGQFDEKTLFQAKTTGATFYFRKNEVVYHFLRNTYELIDDDFSQIRDMPDIMNISHPPTYKKETLLIKAQFIGANPNIEVIGIDGLPHNNNYFIGNDPTKWRTDVPNYSAIIYRDIYPGIDLKYYGNGRSMKYDFIANPGADVSRIRIRYDGVNDLSVTPAGDLQAQTQFGLIHEKAPYIYQETGGVKRKIAGRYKIVETDEDGRHVFGFVLDDAFNPDYPLVIDPELEYSTYLGGNNPGPSLAECGYGIAVDGSGYAYVTGVTNSTDFPAQNPYQTDQPGDDVFITKLAPGGNALVYSTYLGGDSTDSGKGIAVDASGNAYVTGSTWSTDFPTVNPYQTDQPGYDVFVTKLAPGGNALVYSTYLGGDSTDYGHGIAVDASGNAYVTGTTYSTDFPTVGPYQTDRGVEDAFVTKLAPGGSALVYSTYLGGNDDDYGWSVAVDGSGNAYVTGSTYSTDFPTLNPYQTNQPVSDVFVTKLAIGGNALVYSTYLGGNYGETGYSIAVDASGNAYVTGYTQSTDFPTVDPYQTDQPSDDVFITKLASSGNALVYSTYLGGSGFDYGRSIAVDASGCAYVTGRAGSDFPTVDPYQTDQPGYDVFVTKFGPGGNFLVYSTYLGGSAGDEGNGIAVDAGGNAYVTGGTYSGDFPTLNPYQTYQLGADAFVAKFGPSSGIEREFQSPEKLFLLKNYPNPFNTSTILTYNISEPGNVNLTIYNILGQEVAAIFEERQEAGEHTITWNATAFASGVYFARMVTGEYSENIKMVLLK